MLRRRKTVPSAGSVGRAPGSSRKDRSVSGRELLDQRVPEQPGVGGELAREERGAHAVAHESPLAPVREGESPGRDAARAQRVCDARRDREHARSRCPGTATRCEGVAKALVVGETEVVALRRDGTRLRGPGRDVQISASRLWLSARSAVDQVDTVRPDCVSECR